MLVSLRLQALYDSKINFAISTFWDGGFDWQLGDHMNGYKAEGYERTFNAAVEALCRAAVLHFPNSEFAKDNRPREPVRCLHCGEPVKSFGGNYSVPGGMVHGSCYDAHSSGEK